MREKILELRNDFNMHNKTKMLLFISIATNDMVKYVSMYPEVWFLDCTYGEIVILPTDKDRSNKGLVSWSNARIDLFLWSVLSSATDMERDGNEQPHTCEIVL